LTHLNDVEDIFISEHGFALRVDCCGASDLRELLIDCLSPWVKFDGDVIRSIRMIEDVEENWVHAVIPMEQGSSAFFNFNLNSEKQ